MFLLDNMALLGDNKKGGGDVAKEGVLAAAAPKGATLPSWPGVRWGWAMVSVP